MSRSPHPPHQSLDAPLHSLTMTPLSRLSPTGSPEGYATFLPHIMATLWVAFWLLMISVAVQGAAHNPQIHWWEPLLWEGSSALVATGWMLLAVRFRARYASDLDRPLVWFGHYLRWLPVGTLSFVAVVYAIRHGVYAAVGLTYQHPGWAFVVVSESVKLSIFAGLWLGILFGVDSYRQWQVQRHRLLQLQKALADAQLAQLQGQLRPHFLFNALNTVSALMHTDVARADHLVATLGDLLRISLRAMDSQMTPLSEELRTLALYTDIMRERFRDRVMVEWRADPALSETPVPALLMQPLLENVFKHAVEQTSAPVVIIITARQEGRALQIIVSNSGSVLAPVYRDGLGLRACRERLGIIYGGDASLVVRNEGQRVVACVSIPREGAYP